MQRIEQVVAELAVQVGAPERERVTLALLPLLTNRARVDILRFVQPEACVQRFESRAINLLFVIVLVERAAGGLVHQKERNQRDEEQHGDGPEQAAKNKCQHMDSIYDLRFTIY